MNNVEVIPVINNPTIKKKVCGYARVSTADEHQDSSFRLQMEELEKAIKANPNYEYIGIFKDKKSGRNVKGRDEFISMIELASINEIDVIITKSITRFARNIIDTITMVRSLTEFGVEVIFQKENISSMDPSMEFVLNVLAMHAEEESKNISENTKWSIQRKVRQGGNFTTRLFGYDIDGEDWVINEDDAKVVRIIFDMYLAKNTYKQIIDTLFEMGIKSPSGKDRWHQGTIEQMLVNEKYAGHMALGKTYLHKGSEIRSSRISLLDKMIKNHHEPIVLPEIFNAAIDLRNSRTRNKKAGYVPLSRRVTPYYQFVYSKENERYLKYVVERPKGKYEIPTLYCYNNEKTNRVMIRVDNLFIILNDALKKLSQMGSDFTSICTKFINAGIEDLEFQLIDNENDKTTILGDKVSLKNSKNKLPNYIKWIKSFESFDSIEMFQRLVGKVTIVNTSNINIKLSLNHLEDRNLHITSFSIQIKVGNILKELNYHIFL